MTKKLMLALAVIAGLGLVAFLDAKVTAGDNSGAYSRNQAIGVMRTLGSAEATLKAKNGGYGSLDDLVRAKYVDFQNGFLQQDSNAAILKNYSVSIVPSSDGQHFQISMLPESNCDVALFMNESFLIYEGRVIGGCPDSQK
ncbi:MAG TPA: hypothetical protein VFC63_11135 [Blastocatellia bacterium]|nr:hypothetical protein [Blastocatellia bacterium]